MIVKGGVFDRITNNRVLAELCGAKWLDHEGSSGIWFPVLSKDDSHQGLKLYKTIQGNLGTLNYAKGETKALTTKVTQYACVNNIQTEVEETEDQEIPEIRGMKILVFDISEKLIKSSDDRMESEQGTPKSDEGKCIKCGELQYESFSGDGNPKRCVCGTDIVPLVLGLQTNKTTLKTVQKKYQRRIFSKKVG